MNEINLTDDKRKLIANENTIELNEPELKIQKDNSGSKNPPPFHYLIKTILLAYLWFASSMCYYGMTFGNFFSDKQSIFITIDHSLTVYRIYYLRYNIYK